MDTNIQKLITQIEKVVLTWNEVTTGIHPMGGREILFRKTEIGHIHWNGDLDILFGKQLTAEFLKQNLVQQHKYVPTAAITYRLVSEENIPFAVSLLRFSYLILLKRASANNHQIINEMEMT